MKNEKPERAFVLLFKMEADSVQEIANRLFCLSTRISLEGLPEFSISAGGDSSYILTSRRNDISHDEYFAKINKVLEIARANKSSI